MLEGNTSVPQLELPVVQGRHWGFVLHHPLEMLLHGEKLFSCIPPGLRRGAELSTEENGMREVFVRAWYPSCGSWLGLSMCW